MKKYTNAEKQNIINALKNIVDKRVKFWQEDFTQDRELIQAKENALPMIFIARECGTVLISFTGAEEFTYRELKGYCDAAREYVDYYMHEDKSNKLYRVEAGEVHEIKRSNYSKALDIIKGVYAELATKLLVESAT
jgi:hypothetical protein